MEPGELMRNCKAKGKMSGCGHTGDARTDTRAPKPDLQAQGRRDFLAAAAI